MWIDLQSIGISMLISAEIVEKWLYLGDNLGSLMNCTLLMLLFLGQSDGIWSRGWVFSVASQKIRDGWWIGFWGVWKESNVFFFPSQEKIEVLSWLCWISKFNSICIGEGRGRRNSVLGPVLATPRSLLLRFV